MITTELNLPANLSNDEEIRFFIIDYVILQLASKFKFGFYDHDDMYQQGWEFALEGLAGPEYDETRPIEKFLFVHIRNRFINLRRNKYFRNEPPCAKCPFYRKDLASGCGVFDDKNLCDKYTSWKQRNISKKNLMSVSDATDLNIVHKEGNASLDAEFSEISDKIDRALPPELRADYLRIREGVQIPDHRKVKVRRAVSEILGYNYGK